MKISRGVNDIGRIQQKHRVELARLRLRLNLGNLAAIPIRLQPVVRACIGHSGGHSQPSHSPQAADISGYAERRHTRQGAHELSPVSHSASLSNEDRLMNTVKIFPQTTWGQPPSAVRGAFRTPNPAAESARATQLLSLRFGALNISVLRPV